MHAMDDTTILERIRADREEGFNALVEKYRDRVSRLCMSFMRDEDEAMDVAQDVFIKLYLKIGAFRKESRLSTWIYRIAVNACLDALRAKKKRDCDSLDNTAMPADNRAAGDRREIAEAVRSAINRLPVNYRAVIILKEIEGRSYRDIAEILACRIGTVESRLFRARGMLRKFLEPLLDGEVIDEL